MKIDLYTKAILTVIAVSLVVIAARNWRGPKDAYASDVVKVRIVGINEGGSERWESLPVHIEGGSVEIDGGSVEIDGGQVSINGGQVSVDGEVYCYQ